MYLNACVCVLSRPIRPGIGGQKQTFEELLEEQLRLEEQRLKSAQQQQVRGCIKVLLFITEPVI